MKTIFIIFSVLFVIVFGISIIICNPTAKVIVNHIHTRATIQHKVIKVNAIEIKREVISYQI